jgi:hypothetical protein
MFRGLTYILKVDCFQSKLENAQEMKTKISSPKLVQTPTFNTCEVIIADTKRTPYR